MTAAPFSPSYTDANRVHTDHQHPASAALPFPPAHSAWDAIRDQLEVQLLQEETTYRTASSPAHRQRHRCQRGGGGQDEASTAAWAAATAAAPYTFSDGGDLDVCRRKMCEWAFNVVDYFDYSRDLVSTAFSHVDRYIAILLSEQASEVPQPSSSSSKGVCKRRFQSISVTALYMTLKMQGASSPSGSGSSGGTRRNLSIRTFVELSRGILSVEALEREEMAMLEGLGYLLNPPTPVGFVEYLVPLLLSSPDKMSPPLTGGSPHCSNSSPTSSSLVDDRTLHYVYELSRYYTELAVFERDLSVRHRSSCVAFASILCAVSAVDSSAFLSPHGREGGGRQSPASSTFATDALARVPALRRLGRAEVEDAWSRLAGLCPLEALEWPGMAHNGSPSSPGQSHIKTSATPPTPVEEDDISQESPTCVTNFRGM